MGESARITLTNTDKPEGEAADQASSWTPERVVSALAKEAGPIADLLQRSPAWRKLSVALGFVVLLLLGAGAYHQLDGRTAMLEATMEDRTQALETRLDERTEAMEDRTLALEKRFDERAEAMERRMDERMAKLESGQVWLIYAAEGIARSTNAELPSRPQ